MNNNTTQNNLKNITDYAKSENNSSFSKGNKTPLLKTPRQTLYDLILTQVPISLWKLNKLTPLSYTFVKKAVREFEFCRLIHTETIINKDGRKEKIIYAGLEEEK